MNKLDIKTKKKNSKIPLKVSCPWKIECVTLETNLPLPFPWHENSIDLKNLSIIYLLNRISQCWFYSIKLRLQIFVSGPWTTPTCLIFVEIQSGVRDLSINVIVISHLNTNFRNTFELKPGSLWSRGENLFFNTRVERTIQREQNIWNINKII